MVEEVGAVSRGAGLTGMIGNRFLLAGLAIALAVGVLVVTQSRANMVYYYTVSEVTAAADALTGKQLRVRGRVADGSIQRDEQTTGLRFVLTDDTGEGTIPVEYAGVPPDLFGYARDGRYQDVVVEGRYGGEQLITASQLIVAHDAQYQEAAVSGERASR